LGYFIHGEPPEIPEFHGLALTRIDLLEGIETTVSELFSKREAETSWDRAETEPEVARYGTRWP
jgi:hypothetical protein